MASIFGHLTVSDSEYVYNATQGQRILYDAVQAYLDRVNADLQRSTALFVGERTSDYKRRYKLPVGGTLQRRGSDGRYAAVKSLGQWDVAWPLEDFGAMIAANDVAMAYMTVGELDRHIQSVAVQDVNTRRFEILKALFNNTQRSFVDERWGTLAVEPLANGDAVTFPPVLGSETEATESHYLESGYLSAAISDTNNPLVTVRDELEEHFGVEQGGSSVVAFINNAERAKITALADFDPIPYQYTRPGQDTAIPVNLPAGLPGIVIGTSNGVIVVEWRWIPANYVLGIHLDAPAPLAERIDDPATGLGSGLQLVSEDAEFPFEESTWRDRFGYGGANRLNGVVVELGNGGTYTIPTAYA